MPTWRCNFCGLGPCAQVKPPGRPAPVGYCLEDAEGHAVWHRAIDNKCPHYTKRRSGVYATETQGPARYNAGSEYAKLVSTGQMIPVELLTDFVMPFGVDMRALTREAPALLSSLENLLDVVDETADPKRIGIITLARRVVASVRRESADQESRG